MKSVRSIRVGIEIGGTKTLCRVVADNTVLTDGRWATTSPDAIANELTSFIAQACPSGSVLAAVGLAAFGLIVVDPKNSDYGLMLQTSKVGWTGSNLRAVLEHRLGVSVVVETDVSTAALAEQRNGAGLAIASRSLAGALHPQLGHVRIVRKAGDAMPSVCPLHTDCVEGFAAGPAIRARIGNDILLAEAPEVAALIADYVGQALATIVLAWSPDRIVVGSGVMSTAGLIGLCAGQMHASLGGYGVGPTVTARNFVMRAALEHSGLEGALLLAQSIGERR